MEWRTVAAKLAQMGLPFLAKLLLGQVPVLGGVVNAFGGAEALGQLGGRLVAAALGVPATPEAVNSAIESGETTQVVAQLHAAEEEAKARWGAVSQVAVSDNTIQPEIARINAESTYRMTELAERIGQNDPVATMYRTIVVWGAGLCLVVLAGSMTTSVLVDIIWRTDIMERLERAQIMINVLIGLLTLVLGWHWTTRDSLRKTALAAPAQAAATAAAGAVKND